MTLGRPANKPWQLACAGDWGIGGAVHVHVEATIRLFPPEPA